MRFKIDQSNKTVIDIHKWHYWFAWYPVRVDENTVAWLETVYRKFTKANNSYTEIHYKLY